MPAAAHPDSSAPIIRVVACGSVDDGKSTLIGRLIHEAGRISDDERHALAEASRQHGSRGGGIDYALLLDGLQAEREQGITIDVAWRHLDTGTRRYLIADCPGHVQYTRNMATGASNADVAIVLVDAMRGLQPQTYRHLAILALMGVPGVIVAVNKLDLHPAPESCFDQLENQARAHAAHIGLGSIQVVALSAVDGDNLTTRSARWPWYSGPTLLQCLHAAQPAARAQAPPRLPVQLVMRDEHGARWYAGTLAGGALQVGASVSVLPSGLGTHITALRLAGAHATSAPAGSAIAVQTRDALDIGRGDVIASPAHLPAISDQFNVDLLWFSQTPMLPGRRYRIMLGTRVTGGRISELRYRLDPQSLQPLAATRLQDNEIGQAILAVDTPVPFSPYAEDRSLGAYLILDPVTHETLGAGMIRHALRRADNLRWQAFAVDRQQRAAMKGQHPVCVWFTGLSGAGKSTIASLAEQALAARGLHTFVLDGDNIRHGLNRDLGFTDEDRVENLRRVAEVARLMTDAGLIVLVSFIAPFRDERAAARALFAPGDFIEVHVDTPLQVAEQRDTKGLYAKARRGELPNFTGLDSPYEAPEAAELTLDTVRRSAAQLAADVEAAVLARQPTAQETP